MGSTTSNALSTPIPLSTKTRIWRSDSDGFMRGTVPVPALFGVATRPPLPGAHRFRYAGSQASAFLGWPADEIVKRLGPASYVCVLSHDPKFDEPCVRLALRSPARYVGVIGSKKNQEKRRAALAEEGFSKEEIARLSGPIGLPLGGKQPNEIALSIMAELVKARYGAPALP